MKRRISVRPGGRKNGKKRLTLSGREGKRLRIVLYCAAALVALIIGAKFLKPKTQLMNTAEMKKIVEQGVLVVGVRNDIPRFNEDGEGFEIELARRFAEYILPDTGDYSAEKLVTVSAQTAVTKLSDGSINAAIAMMQRGASAKFAYSYPYYTDECVIAVMDEKDARPLQDMLIGFVQNTSGDNVLKSYINVHETKVETSLLDKLRGVKKELPEDAVIFTKKAFASYPDLLSALKSGRIDCAALPKVYADMYAERYGFSLRKDSIGSISYSIAVPEDEPALAQLADVFLYELEKSGELDAMLEKYGLK